MKTFKVYLLLFVLLGTTASRGAVIRHDVPDSEYVNFYATDPMFQSTGWIAGETAEGKFVAGSGVLIAPQWVLTAAHVIDRQYNSGDGPAEWTGFSFSMSRSIYNDPPHYSTADLWITVPNFGPNFVRAQGADLGLIHLTEPITSVAPVERFRGDVEFGTSMYMGGYGVPGKAELGVLAFDGVGRAGTNVTFKDIQYPTGTSYIFTRFDDPFFGTTPLEIQGSPGDSGGPWFNEQGQLIGISSWIRGEPNYHYVSTTAATNVSMYNDWIDAYVHSTPEPSSIVMALTAFMIFFGIRKKLSGVRAG